MKSVTGADWIIPVPGHSALFVVENVGFDTSGPTSRCYLRPLNGGPDVTLPAPGRITDAQVSPAGDRVFLASERGTTRGFDTDGKALWQAATPTGGILCLSPNARQLVVGTREGRLFLLDPQTGALQRETDLNRFNVTTGERFIAQLSALADVPDEAGARARVPPPLPAPAYVSSLSAEAVQFGPNLLPAAVVRKRLAPVHPLPGGPALPKNVGVLSGSANFAITVEAGQTILVELLTGLAPGATSTPWTRLEASVGPDKDGAVPFYTCRLPVGQRLTRQRFAFRPKRSGHVRLSLRTVKPSTTGAGRKARKTYAPAAPTDTPMLIGKLTVVTMTFSGANLVLERGAAAQTEAQGSLRLPGQTVDRRQLDPALETVPVSPSRFASGRRHHQRPRVAVDQGSQRH